MVLQTATGGCYSLLWQFFVLKILSKKVFTNQLSDNIINLHNILKITKVL